MNKSVVRAFQKGGDAMLLTVPLVGLDFAAFRAIFGLADSVELPGAEFPVNESQARALEHYASQKIDTTRADWFAEIR